MMVVTALGGLWARGGRPAEAEDEEALRHVCAMMRCDGRDSRREGERGRCATTIELSGEAGE